MTTSVPTRHDPELDLVLERVIDVPPHLVWTDALLPGYRPAERASLNFTAVLTLEPHATGTRYVATLMHRDEAGREQHEQMGFHEGWGKALDQLVAHARTR